MESNMFSSQVVRRFVMSFSSWAHLFLSVQQTTSCVCISVQIRVEFCGVNSIVCLWSCNVLSIKGQRYNPAFLRFGLKNPVTLSGSPCLQNISVFGRSNMNFSYKPFQWFFLWMLLMLIDKVVQFLNIQDTRTVQYMRHWNVDTDFCLMDSSTLSPSCLGLCIFSPKLASRDVWVLCKPLSILFLLPSMYYIVSAAKETRAALCTSPLTCLCIPIYFPVNTNVYDFAKFTMACLATGAEGKK